MATSINGWPVLRPSNNALKTFVVPGTKRKMTLRADTAPLLLALAADYHKTIARIDGPGLDDWGYSFREARAANAWSDHSSGTAMDLNASKEGRQGRGPLAWWKQQRRALKARALKAKYKYVIWGGASALGGDYQKARYWDWMHWALAPDTKLFQIRRQINALGIKSNGTLYGKRPNVSVHVVQPGKTNAHVTIVKNALRKEFPRAKISPTATFDSTVTAAWLAWEKKMGRGAKADRKPDYDSLIALGNRHGFKVVL